MSARVEVLRPDDLLVAEVEGINLTIVPGDTARLVRADRTQPAFVVVRLPPQHVAEEGFTEADNGDLALRAGVPPARAILAGESRLVFRMPDELDTLALTIDDLLAWERLVPRVAPNAETPAALFRRGASPADPDAVTDGAPYTAIECPYRLILSPDAAARWHHATRPITRDDPTSGAKRTELWHTRLLTSGTRPQLRAIWARDFAAPPNLMDAELSVSSSSRKEIVTLSSDFTQPLGIATSTGGALPPELVNDPFLFYNPRPLDAERLFMTALGGWLHVEGAWDFPDLRAVCQHFGINGSNVVTDATEVSPNRFNLTGWRHIAAQGRDQYVRVVKRGVLFPFGNRASLITVYERKCQMSAGQADPVAYLARRLYIVVQEPEKDYGALGAAFPRDGREFPLRRTRITTLVTPNLAFPQDPDSPFFPVVAGGSDLRFHVEADDIEGRAIDFSVPMLYVPLTALGDIDAVRNQYALDEVRRRQGDFRGQKLTFAPNRPDSPGATVLKTGTATFAAAIPTEDEDSLRVAALPAGHPPFLPVLKGATVSIPAVDVLLGTAGVGEAPGAVAIAYDGTYLVRGFAGGDNADVFSRLVDPNNLDAPLALDLKLPADRSGGLAAPNLAPNGLSRRLGPVPNADSYARGAFAPDERIDGLDGMLMGGVRLAELIAPLSGAPDRGKAPTLTTVTRPDAVETEFFWKPQMVDQLPAPLMPVRAGVAPTLTLQGRIVARVGQREPESRMEGVLENIALNFGGVLRVNFGRIRFSTEGKKRPDFSAEAVDVEFDGPLKFVDTLRSILPGDGLSNGQAISVSPTGVTAGYTLAVPSVGVGIFSLDNLMLSCALSIPFDGRPAEMRIAFSERTRPFLVSVAIFGGAGFFALTARTNGDIEVEAALEFGGSLSLDLGVASGGVYVMAGIYFKTTGQGVVISGYLRCGGYLEVLGIITISIQFYLALTYDSAHDKVWGQATVTVTVKLLMFEESVSLTVERRFAGAAGDPNFEQLIEPSDWETYCRAFA
jgi:hypothetical protein